MKWSWKIFTIQLVALFVAALGVSFLISKIIDAQHGTDPPDSTVVSMAFGGVLTPILFSILCGWKRWNLKMLLIVTFVVSGLYSGNLVFGILAVAISFVIYLAVGKLRNLILFYTLPGEESDPDSELTGSNPEQGGNGDAEEAV